MYGTEEDEEVWLPADCDEGAEEESLTVFHCSYLSLSLGFNRRMSSIDSLEVCPRRTEIQTRRFRKGEHPYLDKTTSNILVCLAEVFMLGDMVQRKSVDTDPLSAYLHPSRCVSSDSLGRASEKHKGHLVVLLLLVAIVADVRIQLADEPFLEEAGIHCSLTP
jgi:hypothetical protein